MQLTIHNNLSPIAFNCMISTVTVWLANRSTRLGEKWRRKLKTAVLQGQNEDELIVMSFWDAKK